MPAAAQLPLPALSKQAPGPAGPEPLTSRPPLQPTAVHRAGTTPAFDAPLAACAAPLTSEPPLADATPLTSEPPLAVVAPLTSEPTAPGVAGAMESPGV
ncbi:hypothetical protein [Streptomyces sp. NBC_00102]|uniref:hypothetical protein n=1 Tax=Streptomyces sp. NBC_00102 TaxID=2975652 RepID=UPI0022533BC8|nr:hypothetical protein [Streptomyces sp. NBC_00102]MCX5397039.1 hypothetical protein [Streptomyces sp. NBC_00102]